MNQCLKTRSNCSTESRWEEKGEGVEHIYNLAYRLTHTYVPTHTHSHIRTHAYVLTHTYSHIRTHTYALTHTHSHIRTHTYVLTHTYLHIRTHTYALTHTYLHIRTHTYIQYVHTYKTHTHTDTVARLLTSGMCPLHRSCMQHGPVIAGTPS